jgi:hypothetical protein
MDRIVPIVKNWPNDPHANCKPNFGFKQYLEIGKYLAKDNYNLIEKKVFFKIAS